MKQFFANRGIYFGSTYTWSSYYEPDGVDAFYNSAYDFLYPETKAGLDILTTTGFGDLDKLIETVENEAYGFKGWAVTPGVVWNQLDADGLPAAYAGLTGDQILADLYDKFYELCMRRPKYLTVANEMYDSAGVLRNGGWKTKLGPGAVEAVFDVAYNAREDARKDNGGYAPPLAYNDFVSGLPHATTVVNLKQHGMSMAFIQGHCSYNGLFMYDFDTEDGGYTQKNVLASLRMYANNRIQTGWSEVDVTRTTFEVGNDATETWKWLTRTAIQYGMKYFNNWAGWDKKSWKSAYTTATLYGLKDGIYWSPKTKLHNEIASVLEDENV